MDDGRPPVLHEGIGLSGNREDTLLVIVLDVGGGVGFVDPCNPGGVSGDGRRPSSPPREGGR